MKCLLFDAQEYHLSQTFRVQLILETKRFTVLEPVKLYIPSCIPRSSGLVGTPIGKFQH